MHKWWLHSLGSLSSGVTRKVVEFARGAGVLIDPIFADFGLSPVILDDVVARIPSGVTLRALDCIVETTGDLTIGLQIGSAPSTGTMIEYIGRNASSLGEAFRTSFKYSKLANEAAQFSTEFVGDTLAVYAEVPAQRSPGVPAHVVRQAVDWWWAAGVSMIRRWAGGACNPLVVEFVYPRPDDTAPLAGFFQCPIEFGRPRNKLVFDQAALRLVIANPDRVLGETLEGHAKTLLRQLPTGTMSERVWGYIESQDAISNLGLAEIAAALNMSTRTLQRRLGDEGTTLRTLVDDAVRERALRYLRDDGMSVTDAAARLGYASTRAFSRAFKRLVGATPAKFARAAGAERIRAEP